MRILQLRLSTVLSIRQLPLFMQVEMQEEMRISQITARLMETSTIWLMTTTTSLMLMSLRRQL
mgnify:CR=1 FL=1